MVNQAEIPLPRFENSHHGRKVHCWFNGCITAILFLIKLILPELAYGNEPMEVEDPTFEDFVRRWVALNGTVVVSPLLALKAFSRQYHHRDQTIVAEMQDVGLVFQSFLRDDVSGRPGSVHFEFMQPVLIEVHSYSICPRCGFKRASTHQAPFVVDTVRVPLSVRPDRRNMKEIIEDYFNGVIDRREGPPIMGICTGLVDQQPCGYDQIEMTTKFVIQDPKDAIIIYLGIILILEKSLTFLFGTTICRKGSVWSES